MADNISVTAGSGVTVGADDVGGVLIQRIKNTWGPDGTANDTDTATGKPMPIQVRSATGLIPLGEPTDAKNSATDTTSVAIIPLLKQLSDYLSSLVTGIVPFGQAPRASSLPVTIADINSGEYETVAASQTAQVLGATGATGDYLAGILVIPATTSPGLVTILDNATSIPIFVGGASSVSNLVPFFVPIGLYSVSGAWKVTTGANVSVIGSGNFT